jgi:hypothetical protein
MLARAVDPSPLPLALLIVVGFLVGIGGHVYRSRAAIITGIGLILLASVGLPVALYVSGR